MYIQGYIVNDYIINKRVCLHMFVFEGVRTLTKTKDGYFSL